MISSEQQKYNTSFTSFDTYPKICFVRVFQQPASNPETCERQNRRSSRNGIGEIVVSKVKLAYGAEKRIQTSGGPELGHTRGTKVKLEAIVPDVMAHPIAQTVGARAEAGSALGDDIVISLPGQTGSVDEDEADKSFLRWLQ